ncbi:MAG TPA: hypothetical protein VFF44_11425 [Casimicrobiaceae bacterium]|nr:hypothetical protein [Casimicrobiaceae bacterium]
MKSTHSRSIDLRQLTTAEFARMSRSLQLTLLVIRRAQLASRKVLAATPNWNERYGVRLGADRRA